MIINWFPGHMTKSLRQMQASLKGIDFVIYVVDSRAPSSCVNPSFDELLGNLPTIFVLNKADLGNVNLGQKWMDSVSGQGKVAIKLDSTQSNQAKIISAHAKALCKPKLDKFANKGIKITLRGMVVGVPNVGKSTLINNLVGSKKTKTGDKAGVTRGQQWVRIDDYFEVLDTPGTLYPKIDDQKIAINLAIIGSIRDQIVDSFELAIELVKLLNLIDMQILGAKYDCTSDMSSEEILHKIAVKRGFLLKGNQVDIERASVAIVDDFRKGRLGRITL